MISSPITPTMRTLVSLFFLVLLVGCAPQQIDGPQRIALLTSFEGRYRELGYAAFYPARLALEDANHPDVELLPIDDQGDPTIALERAQALRLDPQVSAVIVQGYAATDPTVLATFDDLPVIIVGDWGTSPQGETQVILSSALLPGGNRRQSITALAALEAPFSGGEVIGLNGFVALHDNPNEVTLVTSGRPPTVDFIARIEASDAFAREPNHLGMLTYDAVMIALEGTPFADVRYEGLSGTFTFVDGYWEDAPIYDLRYVNGGWQHVTQ